MEDGSEIQGTIMFNPCRSFQIPSSCGIEGEARIVFIPNDYPKNQCYVTDAEGDWDFSLGKDEVGAQRISAKP